MSTPVLILAESGLGKTYSLRNMDPANTLLVQAVSKKLPFKAPGWSIWSAENKTGNIFVTDNADEIIALMRGTKRKKIVIDDYQYILSNELLRKWREKGYDKFSEVGFNGLNIFHTASKLPDDVHIYFLAHTMLGEDGVTKCKTPGKMMETYTVEGLFSLVLRVVERDGKHFFSTVGSGVDTVKSPPGMFPEELIDNDLAVVDKAITDFGW